MLPTASVVSFEETTDAFGPHIVYNIAVQCGDSVVTVQRRYTEFVTLHDQLKSANHIIAEYPFPRRRLTSGLLSKSKIANERREAFNTYLQFILEVNPRLTHISDFLNISTEDEDDDDDACSPLHETLDGVSLQAALERSVLKDKNNLDTSTETTPPKGPSLGNRGNLIITVLVTLVFFPLVWFHITYPGNLGSFHKREWSVIDWQSRSTDRGRDKGELDKVLMHATNVFSTSGMIGGVRFSLEVLIAVLVVISVSHRITGFLFGMLVRFMLCKVSGSFQVEFEWVALRLGFDRNEVVFHNIKWHNPPQFTETPHFLMIEEVIVRFELLSCLGALLSHRSYVAHVHSVLIENVEVYIEKLHQNQNQSPSPGLSQSQSRGKDKDVVKRRGEGSGTSSGKAAINFFCAIGEIEEVVVVREDFSRRVHQYASSMFSSILGISATSPLKKTDKGDRGDRVEKGERGENATSASRKSSGQTSSKGISFRFSGQGQGQGQGGEAEKCSPSYSVKSDNDAGRYHDTSMLNMTDDDAAAAIKENITSILKEKEREKEKDKDKISSGKAAFAEIFGLSSRMTSSSDIPTGSYPGSSARSPYSSPYDPTQSLKDETSPSDKDAYSEDENSNLFSFWDRDKENEKTVIENNINSYLSLYSQEKNKDKHKDSTQDTGDSTPKKRKIKKKSPHFGIKYRFQIDLLTVKDLRVHAQELLYPTHGEINDSKTIKLATFALDKKQLSKTAKNSTINSSIFTSDSAVEKKADKGIAEGSYADEILNRIIAVIQYEIVAKNKLSLASNLFGAAANHTASAVRVAATTAKRGVADSVIAHNPKELFHMATRVINKTVYSQKYQNALSLAVLAHTRLKVRVLLGKNFTKNSKAMEQTMVCSCRLLGPPDSDGYSSTKFESYKTHPKRPDSAHLVSWNEVIILSPIISYSAILHIRVFEYHLLKDVFICELFLPLHELLLLGSGDERENKEDKEKFDSIKMKENTGVGKDVVKEVVKEAAHDAMLEVVKEDAEEDKLRNSRFNTKKLENVFGNIIHSAHTAINDQISSLKTNTENSMLSSKRTNNSNNRNSSENEVKYDNIYESEEKSLFVTNDFIDKSDFLSENILHSGKDKEKEKEGVKIMTKAETKEKIEWFKCFGRLADNELNVEKGQVYLGLLLE